MAGFRPLAAIEPERDFSGRWILDPVTSNTQALPEPLERTLTVAQQDASIQCSSSFNGSTVAWSYSLNRQETQYSVGDEGRSSLVKWEGRALLVNTLVSGRQDYAVMDRWELSRDRSRLTI